MDKKQIRNWLEDANTKGLLSDEKYEQYFRELNSTDNPSEFWKSSRGEVSGLGGAVNIDKTYKTDVDFADMVAKEIPNIDYEDLTPANKRDIAKNLNVSVEDVDKAIDTLWQRDLDRAIEDGENEKENRRISSQYQRAQDVKNSKSAKLGNEYSIRRYIEGASPAEIVANEVASKVGTAADFIPKAMPYVGQIAPAIHPTVRAIQRAIYTPADEYDVGSELTKLGVDVGTNYLFGNVADKLAKKKIGDTAADLAGATGLGGKLAGDVVEGALDKVKNENIRKYLISGAAPGVLRNKEQITKSQDEGTKAIKEAEDAFEKAVKETQRRYKDRWNKGQMLPTSNDSDVLKEAYRRYIGE